MLHPSENSLIKKFEMLKPRQKLTLVGCKQACEYIMKTRITANSSNSPACLRTRNTLESAPKKFPLFWIKESLPCCQVQIEDQKDLLHAQQHVTVADTKKMNNLEKERSETIASRQDVFVLFAENP